MPAWQNLLYIHFTWHRRDTVPVWIWLLQEQEEGTSYLGAPCGNMKNQTTCLRPKSKGKPKWSFVSTLRNISNAFPSLSHQAMDKAFKINEEDETEENHQHKLLLRHLYTRMNISISTRQGEGIRMRPQCGGARGDVGMPTIFRRT